MPHQTKRKMSNNVQVNGDVPHSAFIEHLLAYPVVNDSVSTFKSNPYGQRSIELGDSAYRTFAAPFLPYFSKPFQYVSPYVKKADDLGDKTLSKVDEKFPVVKKPTNEIFNDAKTIVLFPLRVTQTGKEHVLSTYEVEFKKVDGNGLTSYGKAAITTALILTTETLTTVSTFLNNRGKETKEAISEKANN
ncbi:hypothetical protein B0T16DRAFT_320801 [Cercophora newfieldiana]|uniref:Uncharacterized protein n=1 Tax=Cercophora newfieldiana TaxID=92897 RepID=A0AA39YFV6_9PEZI|nr:hypothetical protein B0T16DRAFT_320801 [Cercophora newfieldiana]